MRHVIKDFENNPEVQFKFHRRAMYFWLANVMVATVLLVWFRSVWDAINIYYVALISLYANWDTDADAMSASGAWIEAKKNNREKD